MAIFQASKVVATLPTTLTADTLYLVRIGDGFDLYCTDATGNIAHTLNSTGDALNSILEIDGGSASATYILGVQELDGGDAYSFGVFPVADIAETDAETVIFGNVLLNDENTGFSVLIVSAINSSSSNVGVTVAGSNGGEFVVNYDGSWTFDPAGDFVALSGSDTATTSVTYHASNGEAEAMGTLTVTVSSVAAQPWTPAEITTALWLDASDTSTATVVDGKISQRADKSGNGLHATQATSGLRPVAGTNKDDYDGVDDRLLIADNALIDAPAYIAIVAKANVTGQYKGLLDKWKSGSLGWIIDFGPTATQGRPRLSVNGTALVAPTSVHNTLSVIEAQIDGAASFVGTPAGVTTGTLSTPTNITDALAIGGDGVSTLATDLDFHEMVMLASAPDTTLRQIIQGYLSHKWDALLGVTTLVDALPSDHPYKSAQPTL